jgi:hypothetical protein
MSSSDQAAACVEAARIGSNPSADGRPCRQPWCSAALFRGMERRPRASRRGTVTSQSTTDNKNRQNAVSSCSLLLTIDRNLDSFILLSSNPLPASVEKCRAKCCGKIIPFAAHGGPFRGITGQVENLTRIIKPARGRLNRRSLIPTRSPVRGRIGCANSRQRHHFPEAIPPGCHARRWRRLAGR